MKKLFAIFILSIILAGCQKPYEKAVDDYYQDNLNDPDSYELISISKKPQVLTPMSLITLTYADDPDLLERIDCLKEVCRNEGKDPNEVLGYYLIHEYRASNRFGAKTKHKDVIFLDKDKNEITDVKSLK